MAAHAGFAELVEFLLERGADPNAAAAGLHRAACRDHAARHADGRARCSRVAPIPNAPLRAWTPTRRSSKDYNFPPELVGATPFWLAARFTAPDVDAAAVEARRRSALRASRRLPRRDPVEPRSQVTTAVMAAAGMGGGVAWVQPDRAERER